MNQLHKLLASFFLLALLADQSSGWYAPHLGRWVSRDPFGYDGGTMNLYEYVGSSPLIFLDALGEQNYVPPPGTQGQGEPMPPGGPHPDIPGGPWRWSPDPQNPRGGTWRPVNPPPGQSPPIGSWDPGPPGHWDVDDGKGNRQHYDENGRPITPGQAHPGGDLCPEVVVEVTSCGIIIYVIYRVCRTIAFPITAPLP